VIVQIVASASVWGLEDVTAMFLKRRYAVSCRTFRNVGNCIPYHAGRLEFPTLILFDTTFKFNTIVVIGYC
jgi:hypothetical protein